MPKYYENGLVADGDPSLTFGPRRGGPNDPVPGAFSWDNGYRLYYSSLASSFTGSRKKDPEIGFKGFEAVTVSRTDDVPAAATGDESAWKAPVIASKQNGAAFSDHEQITVDDAASSPFFGNVYLCYAAFRSVGGAPEPIVVGRSTDGGDTWHHRQISEATNTNQTIGRQDCNIKTDSEGVVYVVYEGGFKKETAIIMARSIDGGRTFERPRLVHSFDDVGLFDPTTGRFSFDGVGGARTGTVPWIDVANGAPTGDDATDEIVVSWNDGPTPSVTDPGPNERVMVGYSTNGARSFSFTSNAADPGDRPDFPAIGISPDGEDVYLVYDAFFAPWQATTARARPM
ncbi:MAG: exo-alpha-sialidase, partial [Actinobacteria bacterium]|nr:exo-alpha-sialidase [Actinomycetota bacterium]